MPKPFRVTPSQARQQRRDLDTKDRIIAASQAAMNEVLRGAIDSVVAHYQETGRYKDPDLDGMFAVTEKFYRNVIEAAVESCEKQAPQKKRLAAAPPEGELPVGPRALERVLTNRRYWQRILKRQAALTGRAKELYLRNLRRQFRKILPILEKPNNGLAPRDVKKKLAEAWRGPAARVATIFRTETTRYFASAQVEYFRDTKAVIGFLFDSVRDTSRTKICRSRHGLIYRPGTALLEKNTPPCHWNCRSHLLPLVDIPHNREMLEDPARDPARVKVEPLPRDWKS